MTNRQEQIETSRLSTLISALIPVVSLLSILPRSFLTAQINPIFFGRNPKGCPSSDNQCKPRFVRTTLAFRFAPPNPISRHSLKDRSFFDDFLKEYCLHNPVTRCCNHLESLNLNSAVLSAISMAGMFAREQTIPSSLQHEPALRTRYSSSQPFSP